MKEMIMVLAQADKAALGTVRCLPGLLAAEEEAMIWVRGIPATGIDLRIQQLPALHTYCIDAADLLFPLNRLTPVGKLPALDWVPLLQYIPVMLPTSGMPGRISQQLQVSLNPSGNVLPGNALLTKLKLWKAYAETAPLVRLQQLRFAVSANGQVLIIGEPLPALPGKEYVLKDTLLLPCGYSFNPPVISALVILRFDPVKRSLLLFDSDGNYQVIPQTAFVAATRSAIRSTQGGAHE